MGIHSRHTIVRAEPLLHLHADDPVLLPDIGHDALTVHSVGRTIRYPYTDLRKVNFDFAREQTFTHIMELLDKDYRYRLFYIGRVSRKRLNEIAERLQQAGVDATCSLNDNKRFYQDKRGSGEL